MNLKLLISTTVGGLFVVAWYFILTSGLGLEPKTSEMQAVFWSSGCIMACPLGRLIKRNFSSGFGIEKIQMSLFGLFGVAISGIVYLLVMQVSGAAFLSIIGGAFSAGIGCLLSATNRD